MPNGIRAGWAQEQGYLLKLHYQRSWNSPLVDLAIEIDQTRVLDSQQFRLTTARYGTLMTFWGAEMQELDTVCLMFQEAMDGYAWLLRKVFATAEEMGLR